MNNIIAGQAVTVRDGDRVVVPATNEQIAVLGNVRTPGYLPMGNGKILHVSDAVVRAGGLLDGSKPKSAYLIRHVNGKTTMIPLNVDSALKKGDAKNDIAMRPGDVLFIPKSTALSLTDIL